MFLENSHIRLMDGIDEIVWVFNTSSGDYST